MRAPRTLRPVTETTTERRDVRVAVVGGGITGAAATFEATRHGVDVTLFDAGNGPGGRIASSRFAGVDGVDRGADAFLARVPDAVRLATEVGIADELVHPERVGAAVWYDRMHDIPEGLVLGVPGNPLALARSGLLSMRGKARAALEPFLPRTSLAPDSIGAFVRARFGDEVHERLVDALVGSIYATDTDRFSLAEMPQLAALAGNRSLLLAARRVAAANAGTASSRAAPIFAAPPGGMVRLVEATIDAARQAGAAVRSGVAATVEHAGEDWTVDGERFDAVVLAIPPSAVAGTVAGLDADLRDHLAGSESADVVMLTMHVGDDQWSEAWNGRSGYLVPKPVQRDVTAVSFASQKWARWAPPAGGQILRVSLGRDGAPVLHHSDETLVDLAISDLRRHLGTEFTPLDVRIDRWPGAFAQYRPHHRAWVDSVRAGLPTGLHVAGAGFDGIGIPACVRSGRTIAERAVASAGSLRS